MLTYTRIWFLELVLRLIIKNRWIKICCFLIISLFNVTDGFSQPQRFYNWYFGNRAGVNFSSGAPVALTNGQIVTTEGCATISDATGNLLFYTDGVSVWNRNHAVMANGAGLFGHASSTQSAIIVASFCVHKPVARVVVCERWESLHLIPQHSPEKTSAS